jgi:glycosyltransferase involved in cell wall biosynthesis
MKRERYWDIAWDLFPQSGEVQAPPRAGYDPATALAGAPRTVDGETISAKMLELLARPAFATQAQKAARFPTTIHNIGSLGAGGAERQLVNLLIEQAARGHHDQTLLTVYPLEGAGGHYAPLLREHAVKLAVNNSPVTDAGIDLMRNNFEIVQAIKSIPFSFNAWVMDLWVEYALRKPTICHHWLDHPGIWGGVAAVLAGVPCVVLSGRNVHPGHFPYLRTDYMRPWYTWLSACPQVELMNNSASGAASYAEWIGIDPTRITVVPNGVNLDHLQPATPAQRAAIRSELGIPHEAVVVVGAFRLSEEKRPELFVDTFAAVRQRHREIHAVLMGEGPCLEQVHARVAAHGLDGCFHTIGRRSDLAAVMTAMDVFLHTAKFEGTPNVVLEAQQMAMPVVVTDAGGTAYATHDGVTGWCVPQADTASLAARLDDILTDLPAWREKAKAGPAFVAARFAVNRMVDETVSVQRRCLARAPVIASPPQRRAGLAGLWDRLIGATLPGAA